MLPNEHGDENDEYLAHIRSEQELNGLTNIIVCAPSLFDRINNRGKIIIRQYHI